MAIGTDLKLTAAKHSANASRDLELKHLAQLKDYGASLTQRLGVPVSVGAATPGPEGTYAINIRVDLAKLPAAQKLAVKNEIKKSLPGDPALVKLFDVLNGNQVEGPRNFKGYAVNVVPDTQGEGRADDILSAKVNRSGTTFSIEQPAVEGWNGASKASGKAWAPDAHAVKGSQGDAAYQNAFNQVSAEQFKAMTLTPSQASYLVATLPTVGKVMLSLKGREVNMLGHNGAERLLQPAEKEALARSLQQYQQQSNRGALSNFVLGQVVTPSSESADYLATRDTVASFLKTVE